MSKELKRIEITSSVCLPFTWMSKEYGWAYFDICTKYKRNKLVELFIYPRQQNVDHYYHWEGDGRFGINFGGYQALEDPRISRIYYCRDHKCQSLAITVPRDSKYLWIDLLSTINIGFTREDLFNQPKDNNK